MLLQHVCKGDTQLFMEVNRDLDNRRKISYFKRTSKIYFLTLDLMQEGANDNVLYISKFINPDWR